VIVLNSSTDTLVFTFAHVYACVVLFLFVDEYMIMYFALSHRQLCYKLLCHVVGSVSNSVSYKYQLSSSLLLCCVACSQFWCCSWKTVNNTCPLLIISLYHWLSSRMFNISSYLWKFWWNTKRHNVECAEIQVIAGDNEKEFPSITFCHTM